MATYTPGDTPKSIFPSKPSIVNFIGDRVPLRRAGRQYVGLCPFHADKTPSFSVSDDKGLFHCFGCGESGDVIDFVRKLDGLSFIEARKVLGIASNGPRPAPKPPSKAAILLAGWLNRKYLLVGVRCREITHQIAIAEQIPDVDLVESLSLEWDVLADLHEDLSHAGFAGELWECREVIEAVTAGTELDPLPEFPPLTEAYLSFLGSTVERMTVE